MYALENGAAGPPVCVSPKKDWSFIEATMEAQPHYLTGCSDPARCQGQIKPLSTSYLCFNAYIAPTCRSDNRCLAALIGETIHYNVVDGLGLASGARVESFEAFRFE